MRFLNPVGTVLQAIKGYGLGFLADNASTIDVDVPATPTSQSYTLPATGPTVEGQYLSVTLGGQLSWQTVDLSAYALIVDLDDVAFSGAYADLSGTPDLSLYAPLNSPTFTGTPLAPTPLTADDSTKIATTAFVKAQAYLTGITSGQIATALGYTPVGSVAGHTGAVVTLSVGDISGAAPLASPTFTGVPAAPTAAPGTNTTQLASTAFVAAAITSSSVVAPAGTLTGTTLAANVVNSSLTTLGTISTGTWQGTKIGLAYGGTNADLSATGGASQVLKQASAGAAITVGQLAFSDLTGLASLAAPAGLLTGTTLAANVVTSSLTAVGTIGTGVWQGTVVTGQYGGTGVANTGLTITLGGNLVTSGAFSLTFTTTNTTNVTLPTSGTLAALGGTNTWTAQNTFSNSAAASTAGNQFTGTPFAGSTSTAWPVVYINDPAATASNSFTLAGVYFAVNGHGTSDLMHLMLDGATRLKVASNGVTTISGSTSIGGNITFSTATNQLLWTGRGILTSPAAGIIQIGAADAVGAIATTLRFQSAATLDTAGTLATIRGSLSSGSGNSGDIGFDIGVKSGVSGTQATATRALTLAGETLQATFTGAVFADRTNITTTDTDGVVLSNSTLSTASVTVQQSPRVRWIGHAWKSNATAADQTQEWIAECVPVNGTGSTSSQLQFKYSNNGGAYTTMFRLDSASGHSFSGNLILPSGTAKIIIGGGSTGFILRAPNTTNGEGCLGDIDAAAPVAQQITTQGVITGTSNTAGANFTLRVSQGTGSGVGGSFLVKVAPAGGAGNTPNAFVTALTIDSTSLATFGGAVTLGGDLTVSTKNIVTDTTTGTKIGTSTSQKLGFFNATPVVQQTGDIVTALSTLGLVTSGTLSADKLTDGTIAGGVGFRGTSTDQGTKSSGTFTLDGLEGNFQHVNNNGAFTLAPPTNETSIILEIINGASAGTITTSGFTKVVGDAFTTTNGHKFHCSIIKSKNYSSLNVLALQ